MGLFDAFRSNGFPALYPPNKTPVTADVLEAGFLYAIVIVAFSVLLIIPGLRGRDGIFSLLRAVVAIFITGSIMLCNFGQEWEVAEIHTKTAYKVGFKGEITADIGLKIGLRSINITLKTTPIVQELGTGNETINYNERFSWDNQGWTQGRNGFGPFAGRINQEFRAAQYKGLPYPILWIAEYFTIDGEGIRWGRHYRQAGYYSHIMCWLAFPLWILSMILFKVYITYAALFCLSTGGCLILANLIFAFVRNANDLIIPFEDDFMVPAWGWSFWLCLVVGLLCTVIGLVVLIVDIFFKEQLATFFNVDVLNDYEEYYTTLEELARQGVEGVPPRSNKNTDVEANNGPGVHFADDQADSSDDEYIYENPEQIARAYRRRGQKAAPRNAASRAMSRMRKSRKNKSRDSDIMRNGQGHDYDNRAFNDPENMELNRVTSVSPPPLPSRKRNRDPTVATSQNV